MYRCHTRFYLIGHLCKAFEIIKEMNPLEHFSHEFLESDTIENTLLTQADARKSHPPELIMYSLSYHFPKTRGKNAPKDSFLL